MLRDVSLESFFFEDSDVYKCVKLWAGSFYKTINPIMRRFTPEEQFVNTPYMFYFNQYFLKQFYEPGSTIAAKKEDILDRKYIYRGIVERLDLNLPNGVNKDNGFIAFSADSSVAREFGNRDRRRDEDMLIFKLKVSDLPTNVRCILINESVESIYHEEEVLFAPGELTFNYVKNGTVAARYKPNIELIQQYLSMPKPVLSKNPNNLGGGGGGTKFTDADFYGTKVAFYRAIKGRPVEFFGLMLVDEDSYARDLLKIERAMDDYERALRYSTDYTDLIQSIRSKEISSQKTAEEKLETGNHYMSYALHAAVYNPRTCEVTMMDFAIGERMFNMMYGPALGNRVAEIKDAVVAYCEQTKRRIVENNPTLPTVMTAEDIKETKARLKRRLGRRVAVEK